MATGRPPVAFVGITDWDWLDHLRGMPELDEVNFWQPSPHAFRALQPGDPFLFKLHARHGGKVAGLAFFVGYVTSPASMVWEWFGEKNGAPSSAIMLRRIERYRRVPPSPFQDYQIGCLMLRDPVFLPESEWFDPPDWSPSIQVGRTYDLDVEPGRSMWARLDGAMAMAAARTLPIVAEAGSPRYGPPILVHPRLGQGSFQAVVLDAYGRRCAITGEKVVPALEAAHIVPYKKGGEHRVDNGLPLRRDVHALFDRGYITVTPQLEVVVSQRLHEDFDNGHDYTALHGAPLLLPRSAKDTPNRQFLDWHNANCFVA